MEKDDTSESAKKLEKITKKISDLESKIEKLKEQWLKEKKVIDSYAAVKRNLEKLKAPYVLLFFVKAEKKIDILVSQDIEKVFDKKEVYIQSKF